MTTFDEKCHNLQKIPNNLCASSYRFRDVTFYNLLPLKVGQDFWQTPIDGKCPQEVSYGHVVEFLQLHHSIANVNICKCLPHIFAIALTVSET